MVCGFSTLTAFADNVVDTPVDDELITSMVYDNKYTYGATSGSFNLYTSSAVTHYTVETQDFPSYSYIVVVIKRGNTQVSETGAFISGNDKVENLPLVFPFTSGTYTVEWHVYNGGSGWIGCWLY